MSGNHNNPVLFIKNMAHHMDLVTETFIGGWKKQLSMTEMYTSDECFTTETMGELAPVIEIDGRKIENGVMGPITENLRHLHKN